MADYDPTQRTELFEPEDGGRYLLSSPSEIVRILVDLAKKLAVITVYIDGGPRYFLTAALGVMMDRGLFVLDCAADETLNDLAVGAQRIVCVTRHEQVNVRFTCTRIQRARFQGHCALAAPLPDSVYRPQRRDYFRVAPPLSQRPNLRIPRKGADPIQLQVVDLSGDGVGFLDRYDELSAAAGDLIAGCSMELLGFGRLTFDLEVRNITKIGKKDGSEITRIGCRFKGLTADAGALLQRYLHKLQVETLR